MRWKLTTRIFGIVPVLLATSAAATMISTELVRNPYSTYESSCTGDKASRATYFRLRADLNFDGTEDLIIGNTSTCKDGRCKVDTYMRPTDKFYERVDRTIGELSLDPNRTWLRKYGDVRGQLILGRPSSGPQPVFDIWFVENMPMQFQNAVSDYDALPEWIRMPNPGQPRLLAAEYSYCKRGKLRWSPGNANQPSPQ